VPEFLLEEEGTEEVDEDVTVDHGGEGGGRP